MSRGMAWNHSNLAALLFLFLPGDPAPYLDFFGGGR